MPFEQLETQPNKKYVGKPSISYKRSKSKKGRRPPRLMVGIPVALVPKNKLAERYALFFGSGKEAGRLRIVANANGIPAGKRMNFITFAFGYVPMLGDDAAEKEFVEGKLIEGGWELELPAWFKPSSP